MAEHCNLNCAGCSHFSPVAKPEFVDVEEFRRDFERLGEIFSHECDTISLLGGEPLLHPELNTLLQTARANFTKGRIMLVTNGILLMSKGEDFWRTCHDNNIVISITYYPIKLDHEGIFRMAKKYGVELEMRSDEEKVLFRKDPIDLTGSHDIRENFALCLKGGNCNTLKHGRFYNCSFTPHIHHFNEAFGENVIISEQDYLDIYSPDITADKILDWMCKPVPACRYCKIKEVNDHITWHVSKREESEWV